MRLACALGTLLIALLVSVQLLGDESQRSSLGGQFITDPEVDAIAGLLEKGKFTEARTRASELLVKPSESFSTAKHERVLKANALVLRANASTALGDNQYAIDDLKKAASMGHPNAPYLAAARLVVQAAGEQDLNLRPDLLQQAQSYYEMGAELGSAECIDQVQMIYRQQGKTEQENYWFLLERMAEAPEAVKKFYSIYTGRFTEADRAFLTNVMKKHSLSGGQVDARTNLVPGRSTLTAALVDLLMRRELAFVWRAFFDESKDPRASGTVLESFHEYRNTIPQTDFADAFLLVARGPSLSKEANVISLSSQGDLALSLLPGDGIFVRCGALTHYATVWSIDEGHDRLQLLDPFYEFWQTSHNRCITRSERELYKHERELVNVPLSEARKILFAVTAIRDRKAS